MNRPGKDRKSEEAALATLARLRNEGDVLSGLLRPTAAHGGADDTEEHDPIERYGRRIGRGLAAVAFLGLCAYLYASYVR